MTSDKEKYINEKLDELFVGSLIQACRWGAVLFLLLGVLDYISVPGHFSSFLAVRIIMAAALVATARIAAASQGRTPVFYRTLALTALACSAAAVEFMILKSGGHQSSYHEAVILLALCAIGFVQAPLWLHAVAAALIYLTFALPILLLETITDSRGFFAANTFIITSLLSIVLLRYLRQKSLVRELGLQYDLDRQQAALAEEVKTQTAQLNAAVMDLKKALAERNKTGQELLESEEKYRLLAEHAGEGVLVAQDGILKFVNPHLTELTGYSREELTGRPFLEFVHPDDRDAVLQQHLKRLRGELPPTFSYPLRIVTRSNQTLWVETRGAMTSWEGKPATVNFITDVTERMRSEHALQESEEKFRTLFEESRDVFYISVPEGRFLDINPAGVELFGYASKEEVLNLNITQDLYVYPEERVRFVDLVDRTGYAKDYEVHMKRKDGEVLTVLITSTAVRDHSGKLTAFRGIIRDVTEQKKLEQQLVQSQKMEAVGQLAGGIAHDFNNILTAIVGYAGILRRRMSGGDPHRAYVEHILSASERASSLTRSLLAFSRKQIMNPGPVDLNAIVQKADKLLVRLIGEDIELRTLTGPDALVVIADSVQMEQVLMNLATNARDAMPRGGSLTIETREEIVTPEQARLNRGMKPGSYALMIVSDTGEGMDDATREKIFEPFFTTKEIGKGTGLGLAMVYGIVKQHDGYIAATSRPGRGASFAIYLPLAPQSVGRSIPETRHDAVSGGSETILLGEDNDTVRFMTKDLLGDFGYDVIAAADGPEAVRKFMENRDRVDLLVLDVIMPKMNGREVYETIKKVNPRIKVIFTSGYAGDIIRTKGMIDQDAHFLQKPAAIDELLQKIRSVLDDSPR